MSRAGILARLTPLLGAALILLSASSSRAVQPDEVLQDPALERRARAISGGLRCLVCQNQSIDESDAPLAKDLRVLVRERLRAGDRDDQVESFVVHRYGEFVLLKPTFGFHTALLWLGPLLVLGAGLVGLRMTLRQHRSEGGALTPEERAALEARLARHAGPSNNG